MKVSGKCTCAVQSLSPLHNTTHSQKSEILLLSFNAFDGFYALDFSLRYVKLFHFHKKKNREEKRTIRCTLFVFSWFWTFFSTEILDKMITKKKRAVELIALSINIIFSSNAENDNINALQPFLYLEFRFWFARLFLF